MNKKILTIVLLVSMFQFFSRANERSEIAKQIKNEKISLETGWPRDPNIKRSEFNKQRIAKIRELNGKLKKLEAKKQK